MRKALLTALHSSRRSNFHAFSVAEPLQPFGKATGLPAARRYAEDASSSGQSWMPQWLQSRLPGVLGGTRELDQLDNLTLDAYATFMKRARQLGSLTGFAYDSGKANAPIVQGTFRLHEAIIGHMTAEERTDLSLFGAAARQRVATAADCSLDQVDDCIAKYQWMAQMTKQVAERKRAGQPIPRSAEELEGLLGNWRRYKEQQPALTKGPAGTQTVPVHALGPRRQRCGLAGHAVSRNTKCPLTRKAYKACCGRTQQH